MTVEELNVIITADAEGFRNEIALVNGSLEELRKKIRNAAVEASAAFSGMMRVSASIGENEPESGAETVVAEAAEKSAVSGSIFTYGTPSYLKDMVPAAKVPSLRRGETVVGAIKEGTAQSASENQPIQVNTTVELDGDVIGESVNRFNARRQRITND